MPPLRYRRSGVGVDGASLQDDFHSWREGLHVSDPSCQGFLYNSLITILQWLQVRRDGNEYVQPSELACVLLTISVQSSSCRFFCRDSGSPLTPRTRFSGTWVEVSPRLSRIRGRLNLPCPSESPSCPKPRLDRRRRSIQITTRRIEIRLLCLPYKITIALPTPVLIVMSLRLSNTTTFTKPALCGSPTRPEQIHCVHSTSVCNGTDNSVQFLNSCLGQPRLQCTLAPTYSSSTSNQHHHMRENCQQPRPAPIPHN